MRAGIAVEPILGKNAPAVLAERLRESILAGSIAEGTQLPAERVLAEQSQLSRSSVREALRILEVEGLIVTRSGRNGGPVVVAPGGESLERPLETFIRGRAIRPQDLVEALLVIEPAVARLAAANRTEEDLERLAELTEQLARSPDRAERLAVNTEVHVALTAASHNDLLAAIMQGLSQAIHAATSAQAFAVPGVTELAVSSYRRISEALESGDADAAERRVRRHIVYAAEIAQRAREQAAG